MRLWMRRLAVPALVLLLRCGPISSAQAQHNTPAQLPGGVPSVQVGNGPEQDQVALDARRKQAELRNDERQKRLVADSERLLQLATSLHDDVTKTNKNVLSLDVVKRAEEIEKLARSVKERMRNF